MAACSIFEEDEVSVITNKGYKCGLVVESSEYVSSDEEEDSYSQECLYQHVRKGLVRVAWHPDGHEDVVEEKSVQLVDRSLMPGDVVRRFIEGQDSQRGYVRNTEVMCHVQVLGKNKVIRNIKSNQLEPLRFWDSEPGDVTMDSWVGKIEHINEEVTLKFPDNAMCQVCDDEFINELFRFEDINEKRPRDTEFCTNDYYPGQQFRGELGDLESAKWIKSTSKHSPSTAKKNDHKEVIITVDKVEAKSIDVHWLCRGYAKVENPLARMEPPQRTLSAAHLSRLKKLDCFEACSVQLGDKAFYTIKPSDLVEPLKLKGGQSALDIIMGPKDTEGVDLFVPAQGENQTATTDTAENGKDNNVLPTNGSIPSIQNGLIENGADHVQHSDGVADDSDYEDEDDDAASDSGSTLSGMSTASNASSSSAKKKKVKGPGLQTKLLRKKKLKKIRARRESYRNRELRVGDRVPVEIIYTFSIIEVMWQDSSIEKGIPSTELYPIHHLDELEFFPGDFVVRNTDIGTTGDSYGVVESVDHLGRTCQVRWMKPYQVGKSNRPDESIVSEEMSVYDVKDHPDYKFRPGHVVVRVGGYEENHSEAAGQVFELTKDGRLLIQWADKSKTYCYPQQLYLIGDELSDLGSDLDSSSDESDDDDSHDDSDASTGGSWETEDEEEESDKGDDEGLDIEPDKKFELDMLLDTAKSTLQKLEDTFSQNVDITPCTIYCYREILSINRNCKELDRMLSSAYFAEAKLLQTIQTIKTELKREKAAKIARQVLELFENNCKQSGTESKVPNKGEDVGGETNKGDRRKKKGTKDGGGRNVDGSTESNISEALDEGAMSVEKVEPSSSDPTKGLIAMGGGANVKEGHFNPMAQIEAENALRAKDLCQEACRLLKEQIMLVHEDLEKKWHKLQLAGLLPCQDDEGLDDSLIPQDKLAAVEKLVANAAEATANAMAMLTLTKKNSDSLTPKANKTGEVSAEVATGELIDVAASLPKLEQMSISEEVNNEKLMVAVGPVELSDVNITDVSKDASVGDAEGSMGEQNRAASLPESAQVVTSQDSAAEARKKLGLVLLSPQSAQSPSNPAWEPPTPQTPAEVRAKLEYNKDGFHMMESVPQGHRFKNSEHNVANPKSFFMALKKELKMLHTSLPKGIFAKGFEDRMDLFSVMIHGPARTPYEDSLFFFDVQLSDDYPTAPPSVHYVSFCSDRLNPNLYEDGKVCISLLGTWAGRGTEVWTSKSSLLQVLISIQGLILVPEPYYNEAGYEKQKGTQQGLENSRMYNEMVILKMVQSIMKMIVHPPSVFEVEVMEYMSKRAFRLIRRLENWLTVPATSSKKSTNAFPTVGATSASSVNTTSLDGAGCIVSSDTTSQPPISGLPEFPLLPASRGFQITLLKTLEQLKVALKSVGITEDMCTTPGQ